MIKSYKCETCPGQLITDRNKISALNGLGHAGGLNKLKAFIQGERDRINSRRG